MIQAARLGLGIVAVVGALNAQAATADETALVNSWTKGFRAATSEELRIRGDAAERAGLLHVALSERLQILRTGRATPDDLEKIGRVAVALDRLEVLTGLARSSDRIESLPPSVRIGLAAYALRLGDTARAARFIPPTAAVASLPPAIRPRAFHVAAVVDVLGNRIDAALEKYGAMISGARPAEASFARLQRARLLYDLGQFTASLEELLNVPKNTPSWFPGVQVAAWSGYRVRDDNLVLGQLMTLHSPYLMTRFAPDTHLLEAATLFRLCHYESARRSAENLRSRYEKVPGLISRFRSKFGSRFQQVSAVLNFARGSSDGVSDFTSTEGRIVLDGILSDEPMTEVDRSLTQAAAEIEALNRLAAQGGPALASIATAHKREIEAARREYYRKGVRSIQRRLNQMERETADALAGIVAVEVEVETRIRNRLIRRQTAQMKDVDFETEIKKGFEFWPFHGEFWRDEVGGYAFATTDVCAAGERGPGT